MLFAEPTKQGIGLSLYGDYNDLRSLHETIHVLCSNEYSSQHEHTLSLAYDVRKAYEGQRESKCVDEGGVDYLGVKVIWTYALFYASFMRQCAGFQPTNKEHQSNLYRFEHCIENALLEYHPKIGSEIINVYSHIGFVSQKFLFDFVDDVSYRYVYGGGTGKMRFKLLPQLLMQLREWSDEYKKFEEYMNTQAKLQNCSIHQLHDMREWAEFEW
jgi:hypothetical protein